MRFRQLDRITELVPGERISAVRQLHSDEDYLRDHFPLFPVMPGVLMLEALFQASCWLVRATENFKDSVLILKEAKNVKFADFMQPGNVLEVTAEFVKSTDDTAIIKAVGARGDVQAVTARLVIGKSSLKATQPELEALDEFMRDYMRKELRSLQSTPA